MKRGTDHVWELVKYATDAAFYFRCKCGFHYPCAEKLNDPYRAYPYCPNCGARKKWHTTEVREINKLPSEDKIKIRK